MRSGLANPHLEESAADARLAPRVRRAERLVRDRLADARAHATLGDRRTAGDRVRGLADDLAEQLGDARAQFYREALASHAPHLGPDPDEERIVRARPIGHPPRPPGSRIRDAVAAAYRTLGPAIGDGGGGTASALAAWQARHQGAIGLAARGELSDSQIGIHNAIYYLASEATHDGQSHQG